MKNKITAYKGFNSDLTCNPGGTPFRYTEGETYTEESCKLCDHGFHACEAPLEVFKYYAPASSIYHEVELRGVSDEREGDSKICGTEIRIGGRLNIIGLAKAQFEYVKKRCTNEHNAKPGEAATAGNHGAATAGYNGAATAGDSGAATAGYNGAATAGNHGAATAGYNGAATAGYNGAATAGNHGAATAGNHGAATAGDSGAATAGNHGAATARGTVTVGENGVGTVRGNGVKIRGGMGALLVAAEEAEDSYDIVTWGAALVDGKDIKVDTWYRIKGGKFVEDDKND